MIGVEAGPVHCPGLLLKGRDPSRCCLSFQAAPSPSLHPSSGWSLNGLEGCGAGDPGIPGQRVGDVRPDQPRARQLTCFVPCSVLGSWPTGSERGWTVLCSQRCRTQLSAPAGPSVFLSQIDLLVLFPPRQLAWESRQFYFCDGADGKLRPNLISGLR